VVVVDGDDRPLGSLSLAGLRRALDGDGTSHPGPPDEGP
jgi:hypothetical protein